MGKSDGEEVKVRQWCVGQWGRRSDVGEVM